MDSFNIKNVHTPCHIQKKTLMIINSLFSLNNELNESCEFNFIPANILFEGKIRQSHINFQIAILLTFPKASWITPVGVKFMYERKLI